MDQIAKVKKLLPDGTAEVVRLKEDNCSGNCGACGGCGEEKVFLAYNDIQAQPEDRVILQPDAKVARKTATMLYTIPVALLLAGYLLGEHFLSKGGLFGVLGAVVGLWAVLLMDKKMTKQNPVTYHITGFAPALPED